MRSSFRRSLGSAALLLAGAIAALAAEPGAAPDNPRVRNPPEAGIRLMDMRPDKLFYRTGEPVTGRVTVANPTGQARTATVRAWLEQGLDDRTGAQTQAVTLAAGGTQTLAFAWPAGAIAPFGQALAAEAAEEGRPAAAGRDFFGRADRVWDVAVGALPNGPAASSWGYTTQQITGQIRQFRDQYCNVWEKYFWAPDDWGMMTAAPGAVWYSGQARRHENTENIRLQVETSHALGIAVATYGKCMAGGAHGWEMARARPQWFLTDLNGCTMGRPGDVWDLDHWQEGDTYKYADYKYIWTYRWVDLRRLDALDHGIDQLIASTTQFGWDGVRFDSGGFRAHFVDGRYGGNDAVNTRNMKRTKERLWAAHPGYLFGFNTDNTASADGRAYPLTVGGMSHEMREMLAGGGLWMGEGIKDFNNGSVHYTNWSQFARDERRCIAAVRAAGGQFCYLFSRGAPVRNAYQFVIGLMIGAHPYGGEHVGLPGSPDWGAFMTRWSGLLWDPRVRPLDADAAGVAVAGAGPAWWREFVNERAVSAGRRQVIVHLLNPPADDAIDKVLRELPKEVLELAHAAGPGRPAVKAADALDAALADGTKKDDAVPAEEPKLPPGMAEAARAHRFPPPVTGAAVTLRVPAGQTLRGAWIVDPRGPARAVPAAWRASGGAATVSVPGFALWLMVVAEFEGAFGPGLELSHYSEQLDDAERAELARAEPRPVAPEPAFGLRPPAPTPNVPVAKAPPVFPGEPAAEPAGAAEPAAAEGSAPGGAAGLDVLLVNGMYHGFYRAPEALRAAATGARVTACTARDLPAGREALWAYDLVVLVNMPASAWPAEGLRQVADFVRAGGRLAVLGGPFTLGQGRLGESPLAGVLPVEVRAGRDVYELARPLALGPAAAYPGRPTVYYAHAARPRAGATVRAWAGDWPMLVEGRAGRGAAVVFLGTVLGEKRGAETPFWESADWPELLGRALLGGDGEKR